jgi:hypothetical protein
VASVELDGQRVTAGEPIPLVADGAMHSVRVVLGVPRPVLGPPDAETGS